MTNNQSTILVIEDEQSILNNICTILQISGFNSIKANNGIDALKILGEEKKPELIICDVMMPEMTGFDVLKSVLDNSETAHIPFCFLSARADVVDINYGLSLGAKAYITKPFLAKELIETVTELVTH